MKRKIITDISLTDYIKDNHTLLTSIGVFIALLMFFSNIKISIFASFLSFLTLLIIFLLIRELIHKSPKNQESRLNLFIFIFKVIIFVLICYWILVFRMYMPMVFPLVLLTSIVGFAVKTMQKMKFFIPVWKEQSFKNFPVQYLVYILVLLLSLAIAILLCIYILPCIFSVLDEFFNALQTNGQLQDVARSSLNRSITQ